MLAFYIYFYYLLKCKFKKNFNDFIGNQCSKGN